MHMRTATSRFRARILVALFTVLSMVMVLAPGAFAQPPEDGEITGAGGGGGFEYGAGEVNNDFCPDDPLTGLFPGSRFELLHEGTYDGVTTDALGLPTPVASYVDSTSVIIETGPYIINPEGTYTDCETPGPVPIASAHVQSTNPLLDGDVSCPALEGTFERRAFEVVEFRLTGPCTVEGNVPPLTGTVHDEDTTHVITGLMTPCYAPLPFEPEVPPEGCQVDPDASSILVTDYVVLP